MLIWFDIVNTPHVHVLNPLIKHLREDYDIVVTSRNFAETAQLISMYNIRHDSVGRHYGKSKIRKVCGIIKRAADLCYRLPSFDVAISHGSPSSPIIAKLRGKISISFHDNEQSFATKKPYISLLDYLVVPDFIPTAKFNIPGKILSYTGFKENIYIADYKPNIDFPSRIPFRDYIVIRPEGMKAAYLLNDKGTIVPELIEHFSTENMNIIYFPRYAEDIEYAKGYRNVYIPPRPLNGLDVCYYSKAVLTGSGTFSREAAILGIPAVSFYPGEKLLAVDQQMIKNGWLLHSRNAKQITRYVMNSKRRKANLPNSKKVQRQVFDILKGILSEIQDRNHNLVKRSKSKTVF